MLVEVSNGHCKQPEIACCFFFAKILSSSFTPPEAKKLKDENLKKKETINFFPAHASDTLIFVCTFFLPFVLILIFLTFQTKKKDGNSRELTMKRTTISNCQIIVWGFFFSFLPHFISHVFKIFDQSKSSNVETRQSSCDAFAAGLEHSDENKKKTESFQENLEISEEELYPERFLTSFFFL